MNIKENIRMRAASRYIEGLNYPSCGIDFHNVQIHHGCWSGQPIVTNSLFLSRSPAHSLEHVYTTFWCHDAAETYFSSGYVANAYHLTQDITADSSKQFVPATPHDWLFTDDDFLTQIARSSPALWRAVFSGATLHRSTFGIPIDCETQFQSRHILPMERVDPVSLGDFGVAPLGSWTYTGRADAPVYDGSTTERMYAYDELSNKVSHLFGVMAASCFITGHTPIDVDSAKTALMASTSDRFLCLSPDPNDPNPQWFVADLLTAPLYQLLKNYPIQPKAGWM